jgi:hypothetical protein
MKRRHFIGALGAVFAGGGAVGTGAFTSVTADRDVAVQVAQENNAYLGLAPATGSPNSSFANDSQSGNQLSIDINDAADTAQGSGAVKDSQGVNQNAETEIDCVFEVRNQGPNDVFVDVDPLELTIDSNPLIIEFYVKDSTGGSKIFIHRKAGGSGNLPDRPDNALEVPSGEKRQIGVFVDSVDYSGVDNDNAKNDSNSTAIFADDSAGSGVSAVTLPGNSPFNP